MHCASQALVRSASTLVKYQNRIVVLFLHSLKKHIPLPSKSSPIPRCLNVNGPSDDVSPKLERIAAIQDQFEEGGRLSDENDPEVIVKEAEKFWDQYKPDTRQVLAESYTGQHTYHRKRSWFGEMASQGCIGI